MPTLVSILPSDLARTRGGAERYAFELHAALTRALPGWDTRGLVVATRDAETVVPEGWTALGGAAAARRHFGDAISATTALRRTRGADVVLVHGWRTRPASALRLGVALRRRSRLAVMDHGAGTRLGYVLSWMPLPVADLGAHQSEFEAGISPIKAREHCVVRGGIDERRFSPAPSPADPTTDFLMVGRFLSYKGQLRFLESLPAGAAARLIGPSDSDEPEYLQAVRDKAAELGVEMRFDVSDAELVEAYRDARHTVQVPIDPRRYEGAAPPELLGLTMLEAMACGSVPICPGTSASAEFVHDGRTGLTYEAGSETSLRAALEAALARPAEDGSLREGALAEAQRWTWTHAAQGLVEALGIQAAG